MSIEAGVSKATVITDLKVKSDLEPESITNSRGQQRPATYTPNKEKADPVARQAVAEKSLNTLVFYAAKAAREADRLTADQIRRIKPKADLWTVGFRESIETLQRLVNSLDNQEAEQDLHKRGGRDD